MKVTMILALAAGLAWARGTAPERTVTVCSEWRAGGLTVYLAQTRASGIFAMAGVKIEWRGIRACPTRAIQVSLLESAPESAHPGALAYSLPFEGIHVFVFYNRVQRQSSVDPHTLPNVLASVLVHEITHLLQGMNSHSETGVMKAHWDERDFDQMRVRPLALASEDIDRIQRGLDGWRRNAAPVADSLPSVATH